jgi:hypothetical protein
VTVDGGEQANDEARGIAVADDGTVWVTGYVTVNGQGRDIWLSKYNSELVLLDSTTVNGPDDLDDEGYAIAFDPSGGVYLLGYVTEAGENHNIWLGKFDSNLDLVDDWTLNGSENDDDDGYGLLFDATSGRLYAAGTLREAGEGANCWLAIFDTSLVLQQSTTVDGPANNTDKARFMTFDDSRHLFVSGSMTQAATDYDIWVGKFDENLTLLDDRIVAGPTTDEDKGYGIVFSPPDVVFVTGTMIEPGESYNIWLAKYDTDLTLLDSVTINGPVDGEDVAYTMIGDPAGRIFQTGVYTEVDGGSNIWLAEIDGELDLRDWTTIDGPAGGYDTGLGVALGPQGDLYVSAVVTDPDNGLDIWIGRYDVTTVFADGFESGSTSEWSVVVP